ncbi:hypothetical protein FRB90_002488 [Tulasnella sp. 427]|nr:hypothetical protein FRB90_002488 [Tulasnella sp. 427]
MATIEMQNIVFRGIDGNECEAFMAAVEELAFSEGWSEDGHRMLLFIRSRLRNGALRWFARLDATVKSNLDLLVQAMFEQYPPVIYDLAPHLEEGAISTPIWSATTFSPASSTATLPAPQGIASSEDESQGPQGRRAFPMLGPLVSTYPADGSPARAIPPLKAYDFSGLGIHVGRLRIVYEDGVASGYVGAEHGHLNKIAGGYTTHYNHPLSTVTYNLQEALIVSYCTETEPHPIACPDKRQTLSYLGFLLFSSQSEFHPVMATNTVEEAKAINWYSESPSQTTLSDFSKPTKRDFYGQLETTATPVNWTTTTIYVDTAGVPIWFAKDYAVPHRMHPESKRPLLKAAAAISLAAMATFEIPNIVFRGIDGNECEAFIAAVEELAFNEGWSEDGRRMLLFIRSRLRNRALRWFAELDGSVKTNLDLLVQAMFKQYPPVPEELTPHPNKVEISTPVWSATTFSPAASTVTLPANQASSEENNQVRQTDQTLSTFNLPALRAGPPTVTAGIRAYNPSRFGYHVGRLRIVYTDGAEPGYLWRGIPDNQNSLLSKIPSNFQFHGQPFGCVTFDQREALIVSFRIEEEPYTISCSDTRYSQIHLAVALNSRDSEFHSMVATHGMQAARKVNWYQSTPNPSSQILSKIWNVLDDGTVQATLSGRYFPKPPVLDSYGNSYGDFEPVNWTTTTVYADAAGLPLCFAKDYAVPHRTHPDSHRPLLKARIVFEPL